MPNLTITTADGAIHVVEVPEGRSVLDACRKAQLPMEGLCGGELDCSTCHVIVDESWFGKLPKASDDEEDMLDLIPTLFPTSRLACQIKVCDGIDGLHVRLPARESVK
ncbi:MAG: 2Fe-2S iron-sulfur cluster-binding protein [Georgfuchsia sp.]